jgi:hypothetical protein
VLQLLDGLTEEQARRRLVPSLTTLLGLVTAHRISTDTRWTLDLHDPYACL